MKSEQRMAIWDVVNTVRVQNGQNELLFADYRDFLEVFKLAAIHFDGSRSDKAIEEGLIDPKNRYRAA